MRCTGNALIALPFLGYRDRSKIGGSTARKRLKGRKGKEHYH
jgi:hypothetical protein